MPHVLLQTGHGKRFLRFSIVIKSMTVNLSSSSRLISGYYAVMRDDSGGHWLRGRFSQCM